MARGCDSTKVKSRFRFSFGCAVLLLGLAGCSSATPGTTPGNATAGINGGGTGSSGAGASSVGGAGAPNPAAGGAVAVAGTAGAGGAPPGSLSGGFAGGPGSSGSPAVASSLPGCALEFPYQDEPTRGTWLGGDSAYSTVLSPTTALWSFQDTFVGNHGQTSRQGAGMIANSFAYVKCEAGKGSIEYFWRKSANGTQAILFDDVPNTRFWPQQPIIYKGTLFAAMTRVQGAADEIGTTLARVSNPYDPPDQWQARYFELTTLPGLGKGTVVVDGVAYLFGSTANQAIVARLPLDALLEPNAVPRDLMEYLAADGQWKAGLLAADAKKLGFAANVGTSFRYLKGAGKWLVLFTNTAGWPSATISVSTAPELTGPWTKPVNVYDVPEMTVGSPEYEQDNVCYAGIEHNESNPDPDTQLLFSYTCNSFVGAKQLANMGIYLPKIVKLTNPVAN